MQHTDEGLSFLAAIVDGSDDAIISKDLRGIILTWNGGAERLFGYTAEEAVGQPVMILIPPERRREETEILERIRSGQRVDHFETVRVTKFGRRVDVSLTVSPVRNAAGRIVGASKIARDITDRKHAERELVRQREWFRITLASIGDAVITCDRDSRVTFMNKEAERLTGWEFVDAAGAPLEKVFRIVNEESRRPAEDLFERVLRTRVVVGLANSTVAIARDGSERPIADSAAPIIDDEGNVFGVVIVFHDVSQQRKAEQERKALAKERERLLESQESAREEAERASRIKDEFVAVLSHELRTPLNTIMGWTQILQEPSRDEPTLEKGLKVIQRSARAQAQLISDLLDMSRILTGKLRLELTPIDPAAVVRETLEALRTSAEAKSIRLEDSIEDVRVEILGDAGRLAQVVSNLVSNAIKFTPSGGFVRVSLQCVGDQVQLSVADSGIGLKPDFLPVMFQRFRQGDPAISRRHGGLGLGLSIVKELVDLHGGNIAAQSAGEGRGSTFTVTLPIHKESDSSARGCAPAPAKPLCDERSQPLRGVEVLLVEDEPDTRDLMERTLIGCGASVRVANGVDSALDTLARFSPNLIISDIAMPGNDGYELISRLRQDKRFEGIPAIALTGLASPEDRARALTAGFQAHLTKPMELPVLVATVHRVWRASPRQTSTDDQHIKWDSG